MEWFRLYSEAAHDPKLRRIARLTGQSVAHVLGVWTVVLCYAGDSHERGVLWLAPDVPVSEEDIAETAGCNVAETLRLFQQFAMLATSEAGALYVVHWTTRQFDSDSSTDRVRKHREKQKGAPYVPEDPQKPPNETLPERFRNGPDTDTDTELTLPNGRDAPAPPALPPPNPPAQKAQAPNRRAPNAHYELAAALADVCGIEIEPNKSRLFREASQLRAAQPPPTPEEVRLRYGQPAGWWWSDDWRGQKGEYPSPATVRETWGRWTKAPPQGKGNGHAKTGFGFAAGAPRKRDDPAELARVQAEYDEFLRQQQGAM